MNAIKRLLGLTAVSLSCTCIPALADDNLSLLQGEVFRDLGAEWWQWALSIPAPVNPLLDTTGAYCMVGQHGPVWFLAGTFGSSAPVSRSCTLPKGVDLFFPVVNSVQISVPPCDGTYLSVAQLRANAAAAVDAASGLSVVLDNRPIRQIRRLHSKVFATVLPQNDIFGAVGACAVAGQPYSPSVDDGYYVRISNLQEGSHTLAIQGALPGSSVNVFYTLNVVKVVTK